MFSWSRGDRAFWTRRAEVPIGVPFDNIRCYVLDDELRPLPPGAPGELWIGGGTVSDGYVGDPRRTAERYRTLRLGDRTDTVYRTGDLVRLLPGGTLTHLGRLDDQVKVNGNRVELGEVRAALVALPDVRDAAVQAVRHAHGSLQIVAHVVTGAPAAALRAALASRLPSHMIPAHLHPVPHIPLLPNGKTDRRALAALTSGGQPDATAPADTPAHDRDDAAPAPAREPAAPAPAEEPPRPPPPRPPPTPCGPCAPCGPTSWARRPTTPSSSRRAATPSSPCRWCRGCAARGSPSPCATSTATPSSPASPPASAAARSSPGRTTPGPAARRRPRPPDGPPRSPRSRPGSSGTSGPTGTSGTSRCCWS